MTLSTVNLADPDLYASTDGLAVLRRLQREQPVYWNTLPSGGFWALTRYADAVAVYRSPNSFSSAHGIQVGQAGATSLPAAGKMMVLTDRRAHRRIKAILGRYLVPSTLEPLVPALRLAVATSLDRHLDGVPFDFVSEIAAALTIAALGELIGIPAEDRADISEWTCVAFGSRTPLHPELPTATDSLEANAHIFNYFVDLLGERRRSPGTGLLGALRALDAGERLDDQEILFNLHLLLAGGHETTRQALTGGAIAFAEHPDQWDRLTADWSLVTTAVEEIIRWTAPSLNVMRTATRDITIGGVHITAGQQVTMWNPVLNRDETAFPNAAAFDVGRAPNRHLSFGMASHFCLGAWLARREIEVLLEELRIRARRVELCGEPRRMRSNRTWGHDQVPVRLVR